MSLAGEEIITAIRGNENERRKAITFLAKDKNLKNKIFAYVVKNSGDKQDAEMVFDDMIVAFIKVIFNNPSFELSTHLHGYLMGVAKFTWMNILRKKKRNVTVDIEDVHIPGLQEESHLELMIKGEKGKLISKILDRMKVRCKEVLMYWSGGFKMTEIAEKLGYKSEGVARKKKSECMKELLTFLNGNPEIKEALRT